MLQIIDGTKGSARLKIDKHNRAHAFSVSTDLQGQSTIEGNSYNINTGTINLNGSATTSAVAYLKNTGENDLHILSVGYLLGNSTGGSGDIDVQLLRNPAAGTIIDDATPVSINVNKNFGSSKSLQIQAYKGAEGKTLTDGGDAYYSLLPKSGQSYLINTGTILLQRDSSIGVKVTTQAGNSSMNMQVFFAVIEYDF